MPCQISTAELSVSKQDNSLASGENERTYIKVHGAFVTIHTQLVNKLEQLKSAESQYS